MALGLQFGSCSCVCGAEEGDTPWCDATGNKLFVNDGKFTSTVVDSITVGGFPGGTGSKNPEAISWDGTNTPWISDETDELFLTSGQFTSTIKDSQGVETPSQQLGISWDGTNTPRCDASVLSLQSGQFTSTIKTSQNIDSVADLATGISYSDGNTPWSESTDPPEKFHLTSGQFTSTLKTSLEITSTAGSLEDISWDGQDTLWADKSDAQLMLNSGQFSSTIKTSQGGADADGINTNDLTTG